jgi:hypothetical protein
MCLTMGKLTFELESFAASHLESGEGKKGEECYSKVKLSFCRNREPGMIATKKTLSLLY